jgi:hypothetical protein
VAAAAAAALSRAASGNTPGWHLAAWLLCRMSCVCTSCSAQQADAMAPRMAAVGSLVERQPLTAALLSLTSPLRHTPFPSPSPWPHSAPQAAARTL